MKKIFSILALVTLISCSKEDIKTCNCYVITNVKVLAPQRYETTLVNECTNETLIETHIYKYDIGFKLCR